MTKNTTKHSDTAIWFRGVYHQKKTTITYHLKKYHDRIYIMIFYTINISMKFVCLLHESELQVIELTEYKGTDTSTT